ncbi:MAG: nucleoside-diphosphate kinase [Elusimicrobiota bacterium]|jgi:nucleoside-diphosphate kinase
MERTLVLVKPDGVCKNLIGTVTPRFEQVGLKLVGLKMLRLERPQAADFYKEHQGQLFYEPLLSFMTSAPILAMVWEGEDAIKTARSLMGSTDSREAQPGTLRRQYGTDNRRNLTHGSDSPASAEREIAFFFKPDELFSYGASDWDLEGTRAPGA